jgi:leucyl-tRNA synthetase
MSQYQFNEIERKWQKHWAETRLYEVHEDITRPKYYVLDMFPYPSGSGLHVGHPLGYIASDIVSRYKRLRGFNVLHPMGYDAFGLPAEQYAIQTGQHPEKTTTENIGTFRRQLDLMGFSFDWNREVRTCDPSYYKWTQWIFGKFFTHWYDKSSQKARPIDELIEHFNSYGSQGITAACSENMAFTANEWNLLDARMRNDVLNNYRLAFIDFTTVNWCQELGCVLANEEVVNHPQKGPVSERGGYPVIRKKMKQWSLRITAYADRLIEGLTHIDCSESIKEIQKNWIGRSEGAEIRFEIPKGGAFIEVFTTRPDTIFGASFMVLAPEYENLSSLCSDEQREAVLAYAEKSKNRSEIDRMADTRKTGVFTGISCINPFTGKPIPVWVSDYVLAGYGTGAIMAVPAHDDRDFEFAKTFGLEVIPVIKPVNEELATVLNEAYSAKDGVCINSDFLNGLNVKNAISRAIEEIEKRAIGKRKINYKLREAGFGRQRYWGEPFPIVFDEEKIPHLIEDLPVQLPRVESYKPTGTGESPLAAVTDWVNTAMGKRETDTMPGWAGSSWYFLRYMDPGNNSEFAGKTALEYWKEVDLYVGGSEHATGHLLYIRFWTKFLHDLGYISIDEPFKKLVNQGMIMGEDGQKMSKRYGNVVNPDDVCTEYGADTLRLYEMFLGPLTDSKPWNTHGIEGVSRFLNKFWKLFFESNQFRLSDEEPSREEYKILHKTIKKVSWDIENMSFNTSVPAFMVATNELGQLKCSKRSILEPLLIILAPFAPHITEELWALSGQNNSIHNASWPKLNEDYLVESSFEYPVSINGKTRTQMAFSLDTENEAIEAAILNDETVKKWLNGQLPKKVIIVKGRIINIVV